MRSIMETITSYEKLKGLIENSHMVMIYFGSKACSVCNSMKPKVEKMIKRYPAIKALTVEADKSLKLSANFNVFTVPVILLYIEGKETIREVRIISLDNLEQKIARYCQIFYVNSP
jgi:thioredoxin-like negative regulator of GroEL